MACEKHEYYYLFWHTIDELFNTTPHQKIILINIILVFNSLNEPDNWIGVSAVCLQELFCFSSDFDETLWDCSTYAWVSFVWVCK